VTSYAQTTNRFLTWLGNDKIPTDSEFRRYLAWRRKKGISQGTLRKEFWALRKLAKANKWPWELESDVAPAPKKKPKDNLIKPADIEKLIAAQHKYSKAERFYLAIATTYIVRRVALSSIKKRDYDNSTTIIRPRKEGRPIRHLIPDVLKPIFGDYRARECTGTALSAMFHRIAVKADLNLNQGVAWDAIRDCQKKVLWDACVANRIDPKMVTEYAGLSKEQRRRESTNSETGGHDHTEILCKDPGYVSLQIHKIHPWLPVWEKALFPRSFQEGVPEVSEGEMRDHTEILQLLSQIVHPARKPKPK